MHMGVSTPLCDRALRFRDGTTRAQPLQVLCWVLTGGARRSSELVACFANLVQAPKSLAETASTLSKMSCPEPASTQSPPSAAEETRVSDVRFRPSARKRAHLFWGL